MLRNVPTIILSGNPNTFLHRDGGNRTGRGGGGRGGRAEGGRGGRGGGRGGREPPKAEDLDADLESYRGASMAE